MHSPHTDEHRQKATLFCPECGHASPPDGDWIGTTDESHDSEDYICPDCGFMISRGSRPAPLCC